MKAIFCLFYSPSCPYCQRMLPVWNMFQSEYNGRAGITVMSIDTQANPALGNKYHIAGVPTIKIFLDGMNNPKHIYVFKGPREYEAFVATFKFIAMCDSKKNVYASITS